MQLPFRVELGIAQSVIASIVSNCEQTRPVPFVHTAGEWPPLDHYCVYIGIPPN